MPPSQLRFYAACSCQLGDGRGDYVTHSFTPALRPLLRRCSTTHHFVSSMTWPYFSPIWLEFRYRTAPNLNEATLRKSDQLTKSLSHPRLAEQTDNEQNITLHDDTTFDRTAQNIQNSIYCNVKIALNVNFCKIGQTFVILPPITGQCQYSGEFTVFEDSR